MPDSFQLELGDRYGAIGMLWVDLETTGAEEDKDEIIEIGAVYTDFEFNQIGTDFDIAIRPSEEAMGRLMFTHPVREMHMANNLLSDILSGNCLSSMIGAEVAMLNWLDTTINKSRRRGPVEKFKFMLSGSGVGHFDNRFIRARMPRLSKQLVFAPNDVGMVRRFLKLSGVDPSFADNTEAKNHRALDDIHLHLEEARAYRDAFQKVFNSPVVFNVTAREDPTFVMPDMHPELDETSPK